jgi:GH24 family phage-related lysozyme (muramidase)
MSESLKPRRLGFSEGGKINILELIKANIREKEGLKLKAYKPIPTEKYYTIGYGRYNSNIKKGDVITQEQAEQYLNEDVNSRLKEVNRLIPNFNSYPPEVQVPLFSEYYRGSVRQSPKTVELLNQQKYEEAALEFLNNNEYRNAVELGKAGIKKRMEETANAIKLLGQ